MLLPTRSSVRRLACYGGLVTFCQAIAFFTASVWVYDSTGSTLVVGLVMAAVTMAEMLGSILGGALADRLDRKRLALGATALAAAGVAGLALGGDAVSLGALLVVATLLEAPIRPVVGAALPNLAGDDLETANGFVQALRSAAFTLAPVAVGLLIGPLGRHGLFLIGGAGLVVAVAILASVRGDFHEVGAARSHDDSPLAGLALLRDDRTLGLVVGAGALCVLIAACGVVADLPFALDELHAGEVGYGILVATWGVGMTLGSLLAPRVLRRTHASHAFAAGLLLEALGIACAAVSPGLVLASIVFVLGGMGGGLSVVADQQLVQERTPDAVRGRVRATSDALFSAAFTGSLALGGPIVAMLGPRGTYGVAAAGCLVSGLFVTVVLARGRRRTLVV